MTSAPEAEPNHDPTFDADTKVIIQVEPSIDPSLAFEIQLPAGWTRVDGWHRELCRLGMPVPLAVFACAEVRDQVVAVSAEQLPAEVDVVDWCRFRCVNAGWLVTSTREILEGRGCEVVARRASGWTRRDRVVLDGARLVYTHELAWEKSGAEERRGLEVPVHLLRPSSVDRVERWIDAALGDGLTFSLPASWRFVPTRGELAASVDAELVTKRGVMAVLGVRARPCEERPRWLAARLEDVRTELLRWGFVIEREAEPDQPRERAMREIACWRGGFVLGTAEASGIAFDVRGFAVVAWVGVAWRVGARLEWMRAIRALEIAVSSLR